jgi:hypothetical protein
MAHMGGSGIPQPNADEAIFYQNFTCYVHICAPTTLQASHANATAQTQAEVQSSAESEPPPAPAPAPADAFLAASNLQVIDLENLKRRAPGKRRAFLKWLIRKLQRLLGKVS